VWAKPTNIFRLCKLTIAKQLAVWRLEFNSLTYKCDSNKKSHSIYNEKLIISFIKGCRLFFKLCAIAQTATLFAPDKLLYRKIFMGAAQTRNF